MAIQTGVRSTEFHGLPALQLVSPDGATALITLHGAHVVSWVPAGGDERLYLSEKARFEKSSAIRGGIPVIFPQFAAQGPLPRHGFARVAEWLFLEGSNGRDFASAVLRLADTPATRSLWPHTFAAELTVAVGADRLDIELEIENSSEEAFRFTAALHTYLRVREVETVALEGLHGVRYRDQVTGTEQNQQAEALVIEGETDRVYFGAPDTLLLREPHRQLLIQSEHFPDVVVWNPWETRPLDDLPYNGFRRMLCVEAARIARPVRLDAGDSWWGRQSLLAR